MATEKSPMTGLRKQIGCCGVGIIIGITLSLVVYGLSLSLPSSKYGQVPGRPVKIDPEKFLVVIFPKVPEKVRRGVLVTLDELSQQEIEVFIDRKPVKMHAALFSAMTPAADEGAYIEELNREIRRGGVATHLRRLSYVIDRKDDDNEPIVKIVVHNRMEHAMEYFYRVTCDGSVVPIAQFAY